MGKNREKLIEDLRIALGKVEQDLGLYKGAGEDKAQAEYHWVGLEMRMTGLKQAWEELKKYNIDHTP